MTKTFIKYFAVIISLSVIASCSSSQESIYKSDFSLTAKRAKSKHGEISMRIPEGWISVLNNESDNLDLWFVKNDYSASMDLMRLVPDSLSRTISKGENILDKLLKYSKLSKRAELGNDFILSKEDEFFEMNSILYASYIFEGKNNNKIRSVIFGLNNKFYEFRAILFKNSNLEPEELFRIQNTVLRTIY